MKCAAPVPAARVLVIAAAFARTKNPAEVIGADVVDDEVRQDGGGAVCEGMAVGAAGGGVRAGSKNGVWVDIAVPFTNSSSSHVGANTDPHTTSSSTQLVLLHSTVTTSSSSSSSM